MSLINQMLRDLEHRRTSEASSPLGGLSASGAATQSIHFSVNYIMLAVVVVVLFVLGVMAAYLLGSQQSSVSTDGNISLPAEKAVSMVVEEIKPEQVVKSLPSVVEHIIENNVQAEAVNDEAKSVAAEVIEQNEVAQGFVQEKTQVTGIVAEKLSDKSMPIAVMASDQKTILGDSGTSEQSVENAELIVVKPVNVSANAEPIVETEANINKTVRPLTDEEQAQLAFQRSVRLLGQGKQQAAQAALSDALAFLPTHIQARETQAALLLNNGQVSEAASSLSEALQITPGATPLAKLYARILVDQGDVNEALLVLERARPTVSADPEYHALMAALYRQEKKHAQAALIYQQILMQRPGVASWWMGLALAQDAMGERAQALNAFQRAQRAGGLSAQVLQYVQSRITALTPVAVTSSHDNEEFEE